MVLIGKLVALLVVGAVGAVAARRMAAAAKAPISDDECVSCGSGNVRVEGPGAYVCLACGYEGGSGRAKAAAQAEVDRYADLSPEERLEAVTDHVRTAARILATYNPTIEFTSSVAQDLIYDRDEAAVFDTDTASIAGELSAAAGELRLAETIAGGRIVLANGLSVDAQGVSASLLAAQERLLAGAAMPMTAGEAHAYLEAVLRGSGRIPMPPRAG